MPGINYLYERGKTYYFRRAVPQDLREDFGREIEVQSLKTKDQEEAKRRVQKLAVHFNELYATTRRYKGSSARTDLKPEEIRVIANGYYRMVIEEFVDTRVEGMVPEYGGTFGNYFDEVWQVTEDMLAVKRYAHGRAEISIGLEDELEDFLTYFSGGLKVDQTAPVWRRLLLAVQEASIRAAQDQLRVMQGEPVELPAVVDLEQDVSSLDSEHLLSVQFEKFLSSKAHLSARTRTDYQAFISAFIECAGDRPFATYRKIDGEAFSNLLKCSPINRNKYDLTKGKPLAEVVKIAEEYDLPRLADKTVNKCLDGLHTVSNWIFKRLDEEFLPQSREIFSSHRIERPENANSRQPYSVDDLTVLFNTPVYRGALSTTQWRSPGECSMKDSALFWVPLIALFTGARLQEICQLYVRDIKQVTHPDDPTQLIDYICINKDQADQKSPDKSLKTAKSARPLPIHSELVRIGFLAFVQRRRSEGALRLFPDVSMSAADQRYSSTFSRTFRDLRFLAGITERSKPFHSLRHTFEDLARDAFPEADDLRKRLLGRREQGSSGDYGIGFQLKRLDPLVQTVSVPQLDLSHLYD